MSILRLPGLIDIHTHLRDPGQTHKEDFHTGTSAALAGGFTTILDMPNNVEPITTAERLDHKISIAKEKTVCDLGFFFGSLGDNLDEFKKVQDKVFGLKLYLNITTGGFIITQDLMKKIYTAWNSPKPILLHSEEEMVSMVIDVIKETGQVSHFCHVSSENELTQIIKAKEMGLPVTCGVCPHHLFLSHDDEERLGSYGLMKPSLKTKKDVEFLWHNLQYIDIIESDHAPHTREEKESDKPPFGVPGLETTLPLLLTVEKQGWLSIDEIIQLCHTNPKKIFNISTDENTYVEVDTEAEYVIKNENLHTKCGWSPFNGWKMKGRVEMVFLRGEKVFENGNIFAISGSGRVI